ncbi:MAG: hypothetical protein ACU843_08815 [Gammaproteobacteria bacterium]
MARSPGGKERCRFHRVLHDAPCVLSEQNERWPTWLIDLDGACDLRRLFEMNVRDTGIREQDLSALNGA